MMKTLTPGPEQPGGSEAVLPSRARLVNVEVRVGVETQGAPGLVPGRAVKSCREAESGRLSHSPRFLLAQRHAGRVPDKRELLPVVSRFLLAISLSVSPRTPFQVTP